MSKKESVKTFVLTTELVMVVIGAIIGLVTRLAIAGTASNAEILPSPLGLVAFCVIAYGLCGFLFGLQHKLMLIFPRTIVLVAGIMWVIPFPG